MVTWVRQGGSDKTILIRRVRQFRAEGQVNNCLRISAYDERNGETIAPSERLQ
jgi:hypothetical protein